MPIQATTAAHESRPWRRCWPRYHHWPPPGRPNPSRSRPGAVGGAGEANIASRSHPREAHRWRTRRNLFAAAAAAEHTARGSRTPRIGLRRGPRRTPARACGGRCRRRGPRDSLHSERDDDAAAALRRRWRVRRRGERRGWVTADIGARPGWPSDSSSGSRQPRQVCTHTHASLSAHAAHLASSSFVISAIAASSLMPDATTAPLTPENLTLVRVGTAGLIISCHTALGRTRGRGHQVK